MAIETIPKEMLTNTKVDGKTVGSSVPSVTPSTTAEQALASQKASVANSEAELKRLAGLTPPTPTPTPTPTVTSSDYVQDSGKAEADTKTTQDYINNYMPDDAANSAYQQGIDLMKQRSKDLATQQEQTIKNIEADYASTRQSTEKQQGQQIGAAGMSLARMGGYLGGTGSGQAYVQNLENEHRIILNNLEAAKTKAINDAKMAFSEKQFAAAKELVAQAKDYTAQIATAREKGLAEMKSTLEIQKLEKATVTETLSAIAESGIEPPENYLKSVDQKLNYPTGTSKGMLDVYKKNKETKLEADKVLAQQKKIDLAKSLTAVLENIPAGTPITIDNKTYYGTMGTGKLEIDADGIGRMAVVNPTTGAVSVKNVGFIGKPQDGYQLVFNDSGDPFTFNTKTGQVLFAGDATHSSIATGADWTKTIPSGSKGGQCGRFVNQLLGLSVGDSLESKVAQTDKTITPDTVQVGDAVVTSEGGTTGHIAIIEAVIDLGNGKKQYKLMESNYGRDERVTHGRAINSDAPVIKGYARGKLDPRLNTGTDTPSLIKTPAGKTKPTDMTAYNSPESTAIRNATEKLVGSITVGTQKDALRNDIANALTSGDREMVIDKIKTVAKERMSNDQSNRLDASEKAVIILPKIKQDLQDYVAQGGKLNIFNGSIEDIAAKLGTVSDPKLRSLAAEIHTYLMDYRKSMTGAGFTEGETNEYKSIIPTSKDTLKTAMAKIDGFMKTKQYDIDSSYEVALGKENWKEINSQSSVVTNSQQLKTLPIGSEFTMNGKKYKKTSETDIDPI